MAGDKVDAPVEGVVWCCVQRRAADDAVRKVYHCAFVSPEEAAHIVAITPVPLCPAMTDERADLVQTCGIPGLGDDLGADEPRV